MRIALATLCLNESEFLELNYRQHRHWPGVVSWIFVEGADRKYAEASPDMVSPQGLSVDGTSSIICSLAQEDDRIRYIPYGWMEDGNPSQNKTRGRDEYLKVMDKINPDFFIVIDADEFYCYNDQLWINNLINESYHSRCLAWRLPQRHIWRPPSLSSSPRFSLEAVGGYWDVRHVRIFRWMRGIRYTRDHNYPLGPGYNPLRAMYDAPPGVPECIHLGFARGADQRVATNRYYVQRGEGSTDGRKKYVECRASWEKWTPKTVLPHGAKIIPYKGPVPEVFT